MYDVYSMDCNENYFLLGVEKNNWNSPDFWVLRGTFDTLTAKELWIGSSYSTSSIKMENNIHYVTDWYTHLYRSSDSGYTWESFSTYPAKGHEIFFINDSTGWRFGYFQGGVYKTTDRGDSWVTQLQGFKAVSLMFIDKNNGFACSRTELIQTSDGGQTWVSIPLTFSGVLRIVHFINTAVGIIAGEGFLYRTSDGGATWQNINPGSSTARYTDLEFVNKIIFVSSAEGYVHRSTDMGNSWTDINFEQPVHYLASDGKQKIMAGMERNVYVSGLDIQVPVELVSFTVSNEADHVLLEWQTSSETNNYGFEVERKTSGDWETIGFIKGKGTSTDLNKYLFKDNNISKGMETVYRLKQIDYSGAFSYSHEVTILVEEISYSLNQNYPNPFNPVTTISYSIPVMSNIKLEIYNILGEVVDVPVNAEQAAGHYNVSWDASAKASGVYFYKLSANSIDDNQTFTSIYKMVVVK